ncbi:hypothetical protein ACIA5H_06310 [Nocardia sp. NPDC051900]
MSRVATFHAGRAKAGLPVATRAARRIRSTAGTASTTMPAG